jgi:GNAT superfamily N-acetyltransferase
MVSLPAGAELTLLTAPAQGRLRVSFFAAFAFLVREFQAELAELGCPLSSFQTVDAELSALPGSYDEPAGGGMWLCTVPLHTNGKDVPAVAGWCAELTLHLGCLGAHAVLGCVALRGVEGRPDAREVKRLIVTRSARGLGAGRALLRAAEDGARARGARVALLDSLGRLRAAATLYEREGWVPAPPYIHNPMGDALFFQKPLV